MQTYLIPSNNLHPLREGIAKLNKRCRKLGVPEITCSAQVDHVRIGVARDGKRVGWYTEEQFAKCSGGIVDTGERREWYAVEVSGQSPVISGWTFVATLEPLSLEDGSVENLVSNLPGEKCPVEFRGAIGRCDHCNAARRRKETFVVRSGDEYKCVGRQCLKDFLGYHADPHTLASVAETLASLTTLCESAGDVEGFGGGSGEPTWSIEAFLTLTAAAIAKRGWLSKGAARDRDDLQNATANIVLDVLTPPSPTAPYEVRAAWKELVAQLTPTEQSKATAEASIQWALDLNPREDEDYLANVKLIARHGLVTRKTSGVAASIVPAYLRAVEEEVKRTQRAQLPPSNHVGTVGQREKGPVKVRCVGLTSHTGAFGTTGIHKLVDEAGNDLTWFASEGAEWIAQGNEAHISYTVKKHDEFRGRKQTVVTRVTVWTEQGVAAHRAKEAKKAARKITK